MVVRTTRINEAQTGTARASDGRIIERTYSCGSSLNGTKPPEGNQSNFNEKY